MNRACCRIDRRIDGRDAGGKSPVRIGRDRDRDRGANVNLREVRFVNIRIHPNGRKIADEEQWIRRVRLDVLAQTDLAIDDRAGYGSADDDTPVEMVRNICQLVNFSLTLP